MQKTNRSKMARATKKISAKKQAKKAIKKQAKKKPAAARKKVVASKKAGKKPKKKEDLMCFLTTACVRFYGLPDACYELNTLRAYRDNYLMKDAEGKALVREYYEVSPRILKRIEASHAGATAYAYIYGEIKRACRQIEAAKLEESKRTYINMVNTLSALYLD